MNAMHAIPMIRLRSATDTDYELSMSKMNRHLKPSVDTVFLPTAASVAHVSSRLVKEVWRLGGDDAHLFFGRLSVPRPLV